MSRMLQATDQMIQTQQITRISRDLEGFNTQKSSRSMVLTIINKDELSANNLGLAKAKKWMAKIFDVFDDEIEGLMAAHNDLGEAIYFLDTSAEKQRNFSVQYVLRLLQMDCGKVNSNEFKMIEESVLAMSANARRWFIRYLLRTPRNGMNIGTVTKIIAKYYGKKQADVKKHLNFNSVEVVCEYYEAGNNPPCNLTYGKFIKPMLAKEVPMNKWPTNFVVDYKYDGNRYQIHIDGDKTMIFNRKGRIVTHQFPDVVELDYKDISEYPDPLHHMKWYRDDRLYYRVNDVFNSTDVHRVLWPIPQTEFKFFPNMKQNPGY